VSQNAGVSFLLVIPDAAQRDPESVWIATGLEPIPGSVCDGAAAGPGMTRSWGDLALPGSLRFDAEQDER
jgi:hypothetical protein